MVTNLKGRWIADVELMMAVFAVPECGCGAGQWQSGEGSSVLGFALLVKPPHYYSAGESKMHLQRLKIQQKKVWFCSS